MPKQKHKKKKKSHKHSKTHYSSGSDDSDMWKLKFSNSDDNSDDEETLTSLVRRSYIHHLQQALVQNFESCASPMTGPSSDLVQEMVESWSSVLEQKALKASTVSERYRKNMVSLTRYIKATTSRNTLCIEDKSFSRLKPKLPQSRETQTENMSINPKKCTAVETQTDVEMNWLSKATVLSSNPSSGCYDPGDGGDVLSSTNTRTTEPSAANQDVISSTSDLLDPSDLIFDNLNQTSFSNNLDPLSVLPKKINRISKPSSAEKSCAKQTLMSESNVNIAGENQTNTIKKDNLDERLRVLGLSSSPEEENSASLESSSTKSKSNWFAEEIAQSCNFTRIILGMSSKRRIKVLEKIRKLFGDEENTLAELTEKNIAICRRRIATVVVMELTPFYKDKKIASRRLFKYVAKRITDALLDKSYAPETRSIKWKVREFFSDGNVIMSESDCV